MNNKETIEAWADFVIERWELDIIRLRITNTKQLINSFNCTIITQSNGDISLIIFAYEHYGKFVDIGVGNGVKYQDVKNSNRRPKLWYNKTFFGQVKKLGEILQEKYGEEAKVTIIETLQDKNHL